MSLLPLVATLLATASLDLSTEAEQSGFTRTGRYAEVAPLCARFAAAFPGQVRCFELGRSSEGRSMTALVASFVNGALEPGGSTPVVLVQGGIHAGEIDGKDAGFWVLRELLERGSGGPLGRLALVFVPVLNVDGHERFGKNQRPNQRGPEEMGWRTTGLNLNLNRDHVKADTPEMAALLRAFRAWDPIVYVDLHVTDGAEFQHDVAVMVDPSEVGPAELRAHGQALEDFVLKRVTAQGHLPLGFYPSFEREDEPSSGFATGVAPPRFSSAYHAWRNRLGVLVETHSWKDYSTRVHTTRDVLHALLERAASEAPAWVKAARAADGARVAGEEVTLVWDATDKTRTIDFLGYAYTRTLSPISGTLRVQYDRTRPEVWKVPLRWELKPAVTVRAPRAGYVVPAAHAEWVAAKLELHGITSSRIPECRACDVEVFRASDVKFRAEPFEGHHGATLTGAWAREKRDLAAGSLYVPVAQARGRLVVHLFEPAAPDSLVSWGFFNAHFEQKEYLEAYVAEQFAEELLARDASARAEFERAIATDAELAKDPAKRLEWFYRRHPSWDERYRLYPVVRVDSR